MTDDPYLAAARAAIDAIPDQYRPKSIYTTDAVDYLTAARAERPDHRAAVDAARQPLLDRIADALAEHRPEPGDGRLCQTCGAAGGRWPCHTTRTLSP